jgi:Xaa-Pro aminopeptidase
MLTNPNSKNIAPATKKKRSKIPQGGLMKSEILHRHSEAMKSAGLDAMIACSPENFAYTAGFVVPSQALIRHRHAMVIVPVDGSPAIFAVDMEASTIAARAPDTPTTIWREFADDPMCGPDRKAQRNCRQLL